MDYLESAGATGQSFRGAEIRATAASTAQPVDRGDAPPVPDYLEKTYHWAYLDPRNAKYLDHEIVVKTILWRQHRRLERVAFSEIEPGQRVMQAACVYGNFSPALAAHIGPEGSLDVVDVAEVQVRNCRRKLREYPHAVVRRANVLHLRDESFDAVCCYFLLHEMPEDYKEGVTSVLLDSVRPGGKVVFVDYHKPHWAHPLKPVTSLVFDTLEPYAKGLWQREISAIGGNDDRFAWRKETYFGGLYQKVVATRES